MKQPCPRDCPERSAGCGVHCEMWQAYVKARNAEYEERRKEREFDEISYENKCKNIHHSFLRRRK